MNIYKVRNNLNETCAECYKREVVSYSKLKHLKICILNELKYFTTALDFCFNNKVKIFLIIDVAINVFSHCFPVLLAKPLIQYTFIAYNAISTLLIYYSYYKSFLEMDKALTKHHSDHSSQNIQNENVVAFFSAMSLPDKGVINQIEKNKRVITTYWDTIQDIEEGINNIYKNNNQIEQLWIFSHGTKFYITGNEEDIHEFNVDRLHTVFSKLSPKTTIVILACNTAKEIPNKLNIAQRIAKVAQGRIVIAPSEALSTADVICTETDVHKVKFNITVWKSSQKRIHSALYLLRPLINILPDAISPFATLDITKQYQFTALQHQLSQTA